MPATRRLLPASAQSGLAQRTDVLRRALQARAPTRGEGGRPHLASHTPAARQVQARPAGPSASPRARGLVLATRTLAGRGSVRCHRAPRREGRLVPPAVARTLSRGRRVRSSARPSRVTPHGRGARSPGIRAFSLRRRPRPSPGGPIAGTLSTRECGAVSAAAGPTRLGRRISCSLKKSCGRQWGNGG